MAGGPRASTSAEEGKAACWHCPRGSAGKALALLSLRTAASDDVS